MTRFVVDASIANKCVVLQACSIEALEHPAYDCLYLALAERAERPFVTADKRFERTVRASHVGPLSGHVLSLAEAIERTT